ncbi:MAG: LPS export ABC transporter periplasmic protein LptC [Vicinamibacterales bacterium]
MRWQRVARLIVVLAFVGVALLVGTTLRRRAVKTIEAPATATDPKAIVESEGGQTFRVNREREEVRIHYDRLVTYQDNTSKMMGVNVTTARSDRTFVVTADEGQVGKDESTIELDGHVTVTASDGLVLRARHAVYTQNDGMTRIPGEARFSRGRMRGAGLGLTFDQAEDVLTIAEKARVRVAPGRRGESATTLAAGALEFRRRERTMRFDRQMTATRGGQHIASDIAVAHLTEDEQDVESMELRGHSSIRQTRRTPGGLESLVGQDMDLKYGADGHALERALINGHAAVRIAGNQRQSGREISASMIDLALAPNGTTLKSLTARDEVRVSLPADDSGVARTIAAQALDGLGDDQRGLTGAHFSGGVQFTEKGANLERSARAATLDLAVASGFSSISDARFANGVRFTDGVLYSTSAFAKYALDAGTLELTGSDPASPTPHIVNDQLTVDAARVDVTLQGPIVKATGAVKSVLQPKGRGSQTSETDLRMPSMLKQDQPVNVTAEALDYNGADAKAVYTGKALLWQGETQIKAPTISIDSKLGDLDTTGPVAVVAMMSQEGKDGKPERVRSVGTADRFQYEDAKRRGVYTGTAHLRGPQGDLTADRIELFLEKSGDALERLEGYDAVSLRSATRKTTGTRLSYFGVDGRYVVTGAPVKAVDECGRETVGRTLTFFKATDRIVVDGNEQARTQTTGKQNCQGTSR